MSVSAATALRGMSCDRWPNRSGQSVRPGGVGDTLPVGRPARQIRKCAGYFGSYWDECHSVVSNGAGFGTWKSHGGFAETVFSFYLCTVKKGKPPEIGSADSPISDSKPSRQYDISRGGAVGSSLGS